MTFVLARFEKRSSTPAIESGCTQLTCVQCCHEESVVVHVPRMQHDS